MPTEPTLPVAPQGDCSLCPRLKAFREANRRSYPDFHNAPVSAFGAPDARVLIVGLAPGLKGANRTGRPFTGDYAGDLLYRTLHKYGLSRGHYGADPDDGLHLVDCRITNAVKCVPPDNRPSGEEIGTCLRFLKAEIEALSRLRVILSLGAIAHGAVLAAMGCKRSAFKFAHGAEHQLPGGLVMVDSYHCSRYNTNTGRLTAEMFETAIASVKSRLTR